MQELTRYLSNIMHTVLLGLPVQLKSLIYFEALSHISTSLLSLPLSPHIKLISPQSVTAFKLDVEYLVEFVKGVNDAVLEEGLDELVQTVELLGLVGEYGRERAEEEFFDVEKGRRRFGKVDKMSGAELLEKVSLGASADKQQQSQAQAAVTPIDKKPTMNFPKFAGRFGVGGNAGYGQS